MNNRILIIGGYGVFGGRLAKALSQNWHLEVIVAGRSLSKAAKFCRETRCIPLALDTGAENLEQLLKEQNAGIVIDAAGPFQAYVKDKYAIAEAAISCGAHYLDLSDDPDFTIGISRLDESARAANVTVLSGVSSVPGLSSTVAGSLAAGVNDIHLIESAILPGNKAPRGESIIRAIIDQVGREMPIWRGGKLEVERAWSCSKTVALKAPDDHLIVRRWASLIGAPDLKLFPNYFNARSVLFRAGLDLKIMHGGLWLLSLIVKTGLINSLSPFAPLLKRAADVLEPFGSDVGGMVVSVEGKTSAGHFERRVWTLIARDGDGPNIPTFPAQIVCAKILSGALKVGARPCLEAFSLQEAEDALGRLKTTTSIQVIPSKMVFKTALDVEFERLPDQIIDLHTVLDVRRWSGRADVSRGNSVLSKIAGWLAGFPPATDDVDVTVEMRRTPHGETWVRTFGGHAFRSHLNAKTVNDKTTLYERFGWLNFRIDLHFKDNKLHYPVVGGRFLFIPLPRFLLPTSNTHEYVGANGRACFDVKISLPIAGQVASYKGWLSPNP